MANEKTGLELLRVPFEAHHIKKQPNPTKKQTEDVAADYKKGIRCAICSPPQASRSNGVALN